MKPMRVNRKPKFRPVMPKLHMPKVAGVKMPKLGMKGMKRRKMMM